MLCLHVFNIIIDILLHDFYCVCLPGSGGSEEGSDKAPGESIIMSTPEYNVGFMLENYCRKKRNTCL